MNDDEKKKLLAKLESLPAREVLRVIQNGGGEYEDAVGHRFCIYCGESKGPGICWTCYESYYDPEN